MNQFVFPLLGAPLWPDGGCTAWRSVAANSNRFVEVPRWVRHPSGQRAITFLLLSFFSGFRFQASGVFGRFCAWRVCLVVFSKSSSFWSDWLIEWLILLLLGRLLINHRASVRKCTSRHGVIQQCIQQDVDGNAAYSRQTDFRCKLISVANRFPSQIEGPTEGSQIDLRRLANRLAKGPETIPGKRKISVHILRCTTSQGH